MYVKDLIYSIRCSNLTLLKRRAISSIQRNVKKGLQTLGRKPNRQPIAITKKTESMIGKFII